MMEHRSMKQLTMERNARNDEHGRWQECVVCGSGKMVRESRFSTSFICWGCRQRAQSEITPAMRTPKGDIGVYRDGCVMLNNPFVGCNGHHLTETLMIFVPEVLHGHVPHNRKTGVGMGAANALALQYVYSNFADEVDL